MTAFDIRPAREADLPILGRMGGDLARLHHAWDPPRFMLPEGIDEGYQEWFGRELRSRRAALLVAEGGGELLGYVYGRLEGRDWPLLLDACGKLHDLWVVPEARRAGVARALVAAGLRRLEELGAPRVVLHTAAANDAAMRLFASFGFRRTMVEWTRG